MMLKALVSVRSLIILAAFAAGFQLQTDPRSAAELRHRPVLQPTEAAPQAGTYTVKSSEGKLCIKATMGAEYIITEKQRSWYFNLDPSRVTATGHCDDRAALLSLTLPDDGAGLQLSFRKETSCFYVTKLTAHLSPLPVCQTCPNQTYSGLLDHQRLFTTKKGQSFTCQSENELSLSPQLKVKLVPLQMQAFSLPDGQFGKEFECWADFNKQVIPVIVGATVMGLALIAVLTFLFIRDRHRSGYDRI
ncbi:lysosome-associated membrane glycoprotein 3 [Betta splendens]|uniref:Lysosome-associated membrane glycoprotein 3 n=1 Tax=Betta splendens TaxID=158456 RepID=A0A6P7M7R8_BETSP|nr:lysosome-associated membrane glycoprotein 3 [Betta splendens]